MKTNQSGSTLSAVLCPLLLLLLSACQTSSPDTFDDSDVSIINEMSEQEPTAFADISPEVREALATVPVMYLSYQELVDGFDENSLASVRTAAGLSDSDINLVHGYYSQDFYHSPDEQFGYYLTETSPVSDDGEDYNLMLFFGWDGFSQYPEQTFPFIDIEEAVELNLPYAKFAYGFLQYITELTPQADRERGLQLLNEAAGDNDRNAIYYLGEAYAFGNPGFDVDLEKAVYWLEKGAAMGDAYSMNALGRLYLRGRYYEKNPARAVDYFARAGELGYALAAYSLGDVLFRGEEGVEADIPSAIFWLQQAALGGEVRAMYYLGYIYGVYENYQRNDELAALWFNEAAQRGHAEAQYYLGQAFKEGKGVDQDLEAYRYWTYQSGEGGYRYSQSILGDFFRLGDDVEENHEAAIYWYAMAADQSMGYALYRLGDYFYQGEHIEQDYDTALELYELSVEQDYTRRYFRIGYMYHLGRGAEKDLDKALEWYWKAIELEQQTSNAYYNIGLITESEDISQAVQYHLESAKLGGESAIKRLTDWYRENRHIEVDVEQAVYWLDRAAAEGDVQAQVRLAMMYDAGQHVARDAEISRVYYQQAADAGDTFAQFHLARLMSLDPESASDTENIMTLFLQAAEGGYSTGFLGAAIFLLRTEDGADRQDEISELAFKAVHAGDYTAQIFLYEGIKSGSIKGDMRELVPIVETGIENDNPLSAYVMASLLSEGDYLPRDLSRAFTLALSSAETGLPAAQYLVGTMYDFGEGTEVDKVQAYMWLELASRNGHPLASGYKADMEDTMSSLETIQALSRADAWQPASGSQEALLGR